MKSVEETTLLTRLEELVAMGKKKKSVLEYKEVMDHLADLELDPDRIDRIYEYLETQGIDILGNLDAEEEVEKPINFNSIVNFGFSQQMITSRKVTIKDEIFTYRVIYDYEANVTAKKTKVITYADIVGMPDDVIQKMKSDGNCKIKID